jgi:hypothetical protein
MYLLVGMCLHSVRIGDVEPSPALHLRVREEVQSRFKALNGLFTYYRQAPAH